MEESKLNPEISLPIPQIKLKDSLWNTLNTYQTLFRGKSCKNYSKKKYGNLSYLKLIGSMLLLELKPLKRIKLPMELTTKLSQL